MKNNALNVEAFQDPSLHDLLALHTLSGPDLLSWLQWLSLCEDSSSDPTSGSRLTHPIAYWTAHLDISGATLKSCPKMYDDYARALINSTNATVQARNLGLNSLPFPFLSQPINHQVLITVTSNLLWVLLLLSTPFPLSLDGLLPKAFSSAPLHSIFHPEARVIFQTCRSHCRTYLGAMPTSGCSLAPCLGGTLRLACLASFSSLGSCHSSPNSKLVVLRSGCTLGSPGQL